MSKKSMSNISRSAKFPSYPCHALVKSRQHICNDLWEALSNVKSSIVQDLKCFFSNPDLTVNFTSDPDPLWIQHFCIHSAGCLERMLPVLGTGQYTIIEFFLFKKIVKRFVCRNFVINCEILNKIKNLILDPGLSELIDPNLAKSFGSLKLKDSFNVLCLYSLSLCSNDILNPARSPLLKIFCQNCFACRKTCRVHN